MEMMSKPSMENQILTTHSVGIKILDFLKDLDLQVPKGISYFEIWITTKPDWNNPPWLIIFNRLGDLPEVIEHWCFGPTKRFISPERLELFYKPGTFNDLKVYPRCRKCGMNTIFEGVCRSVYCQTDRDVSIFKNERNNKALGNNEKGKM